MEFFQWVVINGGARYQRGVVLFRGVLPMRIVSKHKVTSHSCPVADVQKRFASLVTTCRAGDRATRYTGRYDRRHESMNKQGENSIPPSQSDPPMPPARYRRRYLLTSFYMPARITHYIFYVRNDRLPTKTTRRRLKRSTKILSHFFLWPQSETRIVD